MSPGNLPIVGLDKLSLVDYPDKLCATVTVGGCNFRCPYCDQGDIVFDYLPMPKLTEDKVIEILHPRIGFLDGVCVTGGEPLIHREMLNFLGRLKSIGAKVKMETNGSHPRRLRIMLLRRYIDYVAMDVKVQPKRYPELVQYKVMPEEIEDSIQLIRRSKADYEFRTTMVPGIVTEKDMLEIVHMLAGSKRYALRQFKPGKTISKECDKIQPYSDNEMKTFRDLAAPYFAETRLDL